MKKLILSIFLLVTCCFGAQGVLAQCSCVPTYRNITAHDEFKLAYVVFVGRITEIKKTPRDKDSYIELVSFQVTRAWKRDLEASVTIANVIQGCANGFKEKEEWLVYAYRNHDGTLGTYCCCSRTRTLSNAAEDLKTFDDDGEPPAKLLKAQDPKPTAGRTNRWTRAAGACFSTRMIRRRVL